MSSFIYPKISHKVLEITNSEFLDGLSFDGKEYKEDRIVLVKGVPHIVVYFLKKMGYISDEKFYTSDSMRYAYMDGIHKVHQKVQNILLKKKRK